MEKNNVKINLQLNQAVNHLKDVSTGRLTAKERVKEIYWKTEKSEGSNLIAKYVVKYWHSIWVGIVEGHTFCHP